MGDLIERLLGPSREEKLRIYIYPRARNRIWEDAWRTQPSDETRNSYVKEKYWEGRVKPTLLILLEKLYNNRNDLLPNLSEKQIYSIASVVRKPFEETRRDIEPILNILKVGYRELIPEDKIIVSPPIALIYGIRDGEMIDFSSLEPYGIVRRQVKVEKFDGSAEFTVKLYGKDIKVIFGLPNVPSEKIEGKYRIRKISKEKHVAGEEKI